MNYKESSDKDLQLAISKKLSKNKKSIEKIKTSENYPIKKPDKKIILGPKIIFIKIEKEKRIIFVNSLLNFKKDNKYQLYNIIH